MVANTYPAFKAWLLSLPDGPTWARAPATNDLNSQWTPSNKRPSYQYDAAGILRSWGASAYDSNRGYLLIFGMGHATGCGNDGYYYSTQDMSWHRGWLPSEMAGRTGYYSGNGYTPDVFPADTPISPHAAHLYDNLIYLQVIDKVLAMGGSGWSAGGEALAPYQTFGPTPGSPGRITTGPYTLDLSKIDPNKVGGTTGSGHDPSDLGAEIFGNRDNMTWPYWQEGLGCLDTRVENVSGTLKDVIYSFPPTGSGWCYRIVIDPVTAAADTYTRYSNANYTLGDPNAVGALLSARNVYATTTYSGQGLVWTPLDQSGVNFAVAPLSGVVGADGVVSPNGGLAGDPVRNRLVWWSGKTSVVHIDVPANRANTWTVTVVTPSAPNGEPPGWLATGTDPLTLLGGVLGKWQYLPGYDVFAGINNNTTGEVWIYKPDNWSPTWSDSTITSAVSVPAVAFLGQF